MAHAAAQSSIEPNRFLFKIHAEVAFYVLRGTEVIMRKRPNRVDSVEKVLGRAGSGEFVENHFTLGQSGEQPFAVGTHEEWGSTKMVGLGMAATFFNRIGQTRKSVATPRTSAVWSVPDIHGPNRNLRRHERGISHVTKDVTSGVTSADEVVFPRHSPPVGSAAPGKQGE